MNEELEEITAQVVANHLLNKHEPLTAVIVDGYKIAESYIRDNVLYLEVEQ